MKRIFAVLFSCVVVASLVFLGTAIDAQEEHEEHGEHGHSDDSQVTFIGEVIDLTCYSAHPKDGQGPDHADCAESCTKIGLPVGLLEKETSKVYLTVMADHKPANTTLLPYAAKQVTIKGTLHKTDGVNVIHIDSVELVK